MKSLYFTFLMLAVLGQASYANAQISLPEFSLANKKEHLFDSEQITIDTKNALNGIKRPLFRDILTLQNQIILLESLIDQQGEVRDIASNYRKVGIPFKQSPPSETACNQLPSNVLCMTSYPEKADNEGMIKEAYGRAMDRQKQEIMDLYQKMIIQQQNESLVLGQDTSSAPSSYYAPKEKYQWSDIRCLRDDCSALIVSPDGNFRKRVTIGETLENGDVKVSNIGVSGVTVLIKGKAVDLKASSATSGQSKTDVAQFSQKDNSKDISEIENMLANSFGNINNIPASAPTIPSSASSNPSSEEPEELLGPTGLF